MTENKKKLSSKDEKYCIYRHRGDSQRLAWRRSHPDSKANDATVDVKASNLESEDRIQIRLQELRDQQARAALIDEEWVIERYRHEAETAKEGNVRTAAIGGIVKVLGLGRQDRKAIDAMSDEEIEAEIKAWKEKEQDEATVH